MTELATGYISLVVETSKIPKQVGDAMKGVESQADKTGQAMGGKLASGMGKTLKAGVAGAGAAAGAALGFSIAKGIGRLSGIENAEASLRGLGHSAQNVEAIMGNALTSVRGTAFGLDEAATVAASAVAAGVAPGRELERTLGLVGDAATIAKTDLASMGSIVNKVATSDMMQMDVANQLMDAGIPILQLVSKEMGVTAEEARKLASDGKVSFEIFQNALEAGLGGAALEAGDTVTGSFRNMGAAAGRLGATLAGPFFDQAAGAFKGVTAAVDELNTSAGPVMDRVDAWLTGTAIPKFGELRTETVALAGDARDLWDEFASSELATGSLMRLEGIFSSLLDSGIRLAPAVGGIVESLGRAGTSIGLSTWDMLLAVLESSAVILDATLVPALEFTADVMQDNQTAVTALVAAYMAFKTIPGIMSRIAPAFTPIVSGATTARASVSDFTGAVRDSYRWMGQANPQMGVLGKSASILGTNAGAAARGGLSALGRAGSSLLDVFGGPLGAALTGVTIATVAGIGANQKLESAQKSLEGASHDLALAQTDMWSQIGTASGVADTVVDQVRAVQAEFDALIAGEQRGFGAWMNKLWGDVTSPFEGGFFDGGVMGNESKAAMDAANEIADGARLAQQALDGLKMSNDDVAAAISGSAGDWDALVARLHGAGDGGRAALAGLQPLRDEYVAMQEAQKIATPGALELSAAVDVLADSAATGDDKLSALKRALQALGLMETDAEASMFELAEAVDEVVEAAAEGVNHVDGFGDALLGMDGKLDPAVKNAQALRNELGPLRETIIASAQATGDAEGAFTSALPAIEALAEKYGLSTEKIREFLGATPEQLNLLLSVEGADEVRQKLVEVALQLEQIPDGEPKTITMRVDSPEAIAALEAIGYKVDAIEGKPGMVRITADGSLAAAGMAAVAQQLATLDASVATPTLTADATIFRLEDEAVRASLANLDVSHVDPSVGAIIDDFTNGRDVTLAELQRIDATVADPHIKAEISEALEKARIVNDALDRAARERTATITTQYFAEGRNVSSAGVQVGQQYTPRRASGGRLPLTGPGTGRTDGILGVGSDGTPTAWVDAGEWVVNGDSSQDYNRVLGLINRDDPSVRHLKGYAAGGRVSADDVLEFLHGRTDDGQSRSLQGAPYLWAQVNWGDCSAAQAAAWRFATGLDPFAGRFATGNMLEAVRAMGGVPGPGGPDDLTSAWYNGGPGGGHTTGSVGGVHFEMGGGAGGAGKIGGAAASPFTGPWEHIYHLQLSDPFDWSDKAYTGRRGSGLTVGQFAADSFSGQTDYGASKGRYGGSAQQRPSTWSEIAGLAAADIVGGQVEDILGVFGVPNQLPPILQAWQMLNEPVGDGPTDWDLSVLAAEASKLDAEVKVREDLVGRAASVIEQINTSPVGNALPAQMVAAQDQLDAEKRELERIRAAWEQARTRLDSALLAREAELTEEESTKSGGDALGLDKKRNALLDKEEALRRAREALSDAESKTGKDRDEGKIVDARGRLDKAQRDLDMAKRSLEEAQAKFREDGGMLDEVGAPAPAAQAYNPALGAEQWTPIIDKVLKEKGLPLEYRGAVIHRGNQESRGDPKAVNDWDANARAGFPTKGWMQARQDTFDAYADPGFGDIFGVEDSLRASINYVMRDPKFKGRTLADVYRQAGGYFLGGEVTLPPGMQPGVDNIPAWLTAGERVVRNGPSQRYAPEIDAMNAGTFQSGGGGETHFHYQVMSNEEADRHRRNIERQRAAERVGVR